MKKYVCQMSLLQVKAKGLVKMTLVNGCFIKKQLYGKTSTFDLVIEWSSCTGLTILIILCSDIPILFN